MKAPGIVISVVLALSFACAGLHASELKLPAIIGDNMVIQQRINAPVWGWADPGAAVKVTIAGQTATTKADAESGKWMVRLKPLKPGKVLEMTISAGDATRTVKNILVGEVWVCAGQSNMDFPVGGVFNSQDEIKAANYPEIRHFATGYSAPAEPASDCNGHWVVCSPDTVAGFTGVGYFFGLSLHKELKVPVGLIKSAVGGTPIESWTAYGMMAAEPAFAGAIRTFDKTMASYPEARKTYEAALAAREAEIRKPVEDQGWESVDLDDSTWKEMPQPKNWEDNGLHMDGVVWLRKTVAVPADLAGKELTLSLGPIDNFDITYWNGHKIGEGNDYKESRTYIVPSNLVRAGANVIAVRVHDTDGYGGINGKPEQVYLAAQGTDRISLAGQWKYKVAFTVPGWPQEPVGPGHAFLPTSLYNGMIAPHVPYGIKGVIWYQGEGNERDEPHSYFHKMRGTVTGWRRAWGQGDFPFYYTQIANFRAPTEDPAGNDGVKWATVRQSQLEALKIKNAGMAVAIDLADPDNPFDIHPRNKQDVGNRLALWALAKDYGKKNLIFSGPIYKSMKVEDNKIRISFDYTGSGLMIGSKAGLEPTKELKDAKLQCFAIAGEDQKWHWADAVIDGNTVLVSSPSVPNPAAVRYAYSMNPVGNKLYNKEGLPASPFRTDNW